MHEQEEKICNAQEKQEINEATQTKANMKSHCYKGQLRGACLILFGILLSCYDWVDAGFYNFADFAPVISLACGVVGIILAFFSDGVIKDFLDIFNE